MDNTKLIKKYSNIFQINNIKTINDMKKNNDILNTNEFVCSPLTISTCTVIIHLNSTIDLNYFTRFVNVFEQNAEALNLKFGGIYNIEYYGNCARGETLLDKIKSEFNNYNI